MNGSVGNLGGASQTLSVWTKLAIIPLVWFCILMDGKAQAQDAACYVRWGNAWDNRGDLDKAIADYNQALALCPTEKVAFNNRGFDFYRKGNYDQAIADYTQAIALCPTYGAAYSNRGVVYDEQGDKDRALADYNQAIANDPNIAAAYNNRATIESRRGEYVKANADFYRCLSVDPNFATGYENLGFFQATCPDPSFRDGQKAFANASRAYQLACGEDAFYTANALAAAYAECGDFDAAITWQQSTVDLAPAKDKAMESSRLDLFKQHKPYRSEQKPVAQAAAQPAIQPAVQSAVQPMPGVQPVQPASKG